MGCTLNKDIKDVKHNKIYKRLCNRHFIVRELQDTDYYHGFTETLTKHFDLNFSEFRLSAKKFDEIFTKLQTSTYLHKIIVVENRKAKRSNQRVIGIGTIYIKPTFFVKSGPIAHIEDLALRYADDAETAARIMSCLINIGIINKCSKILVTAKIYNKPFYRDYGFIENGVSMEYYLNERDHRNLKKSINPVVSVRKCSYESQGKMPTQQHVKYDKLNISEEQSVEPPQ